jgi:hypothetical protein
VKSHDVTKTLQIPSNPRESGPVMAPELAPLHLQVDGNGYAGQMSADAAGITACLFALSHLSFQIQNDAISRHYYELRDFALEYAEPTAIFGAID